jgi:hypothetical protein
VYWANLIDLIASRPLRRFLAYFAIKVFLHCSGEIKPLTAKDAKNFSKVRRENEYRWLVPQSRLPVKEPKTKDQRLPLNRLNQFRQQRRPPGQVGKRDELMSGVGPFASASKTVQRGDSQAGREVSV